ncbi:NUDIX domain-containing protein [Roseivirga sp. E12]|uniref:NUDIX domain-containing protein n=1 Tax=Roseivirga sp. E12 TaxID=2819237 RepID=UPI001ABC2822|nr:NUDIX domain-containing protein [Roseivirga sp. E12]MBO3700845.1 NUDIX domain-containing protein [Roseivirga sp. E12]
MTQIDAKISEAYGQKLRVRVCGICIKNDQILLVHHNPLGKTGSLWAPPGGGMEYSESAEEALTREFKEETGLTIEVEQFLFVHEYLDPPLHGIELFFLVNPISGDLKLGTDPELSTDDQILTQLGYFDLEVLRTEELESLHYVLQNNESIDVLINRKGYFKYH